MKECMLVRWYFPFIFASPDNNASHEMWQTLLSSGMLYAWRLIALNHACNRLFINRHRKTFLCKKFMCNKLLQRGGKRVQPISYHKRMNIRSIFFLEDFEIIDMSTDKNVWTHGMSFLKFKVFKYLHVWKLYPIELGTRMNCFYQCSDNP